MLIHSSSNVVEIRPALHPCSLVILSMYKYLMVASIAFKGTSHFL